jgi:enoyl-CoA hydratase/carnithine racemase
MRFPEDEGALIDYRGEARLSELASSIVDQSGVRVLDLNWPAPENWTARQLAELSHRLQELASTPGVTGVVLTGHNLFCSDGRDIVEPVEALFGDLLAQIADSPTPIVAAIPRDAIGAGLELAIACGARTGVNGARFSLPALHWAKFPSFRTLRDLPRLIGVEAAATIIALACPLEGDKARTLGLVDVIDEDPLAAAKRLLVSWGGASCGRSAEPDPIDVQARFFLVRRMLRNKADNPSAQLSAVKAMEAAVYMRPRQARAEISRIAQDLAASQQAAALRHASNALNSLFDKAGGREAFGSALAQHLWWPMAREALHLVDEGASPAQVDKCFTDYGFPIGPFSKADEIGFSSVFASVSDVLASGGDWVLYSPTLDLMADSGRVGGECPGWYRPTTAASRTRFEPIVDLLIQSSAISQRLKRVPISDEVVMRRCLNAAVNAAFEVLGQRDDLTADDIDATWIGGLDFPRWKGGLIYQADARGLELVVAELTAAAARRNTAGTPCGPLTASARLDDSRRNVAVGDRG